MSSCLYSSVVAKLLDWVAWQ
uniref:Uncharacterized protein n=1 Tax=Arundo donax TaxID=35708 RepID=A0A0A8YXK9_ARUDO